MHPKLKDSVQFFPIDESTFHVYDRSTARHFKMGVDEVSWIRLLDGHTSKERLAEFIPDEYRDDFFIYIEKMKLIDGLQKRDRINPLKVKIARFDPSPVLDMLVKRAVGYRRFLDATVLPISVLNILLGLVIWSFAAPRIQSIAFSPISILIYLVAISLTGMVHELSHALVARAFGVKVPAVGVMMFFLHPTFYADVSAISLLPSRTNRINVLLAGVKSNNILIFLSLIGYLLFSKYQVAPYLLAYASMNLVLVLINLIPFVEYDGYYIFQELLNESNFSRHATTSMLSAGGGRADYAIYFAVSQLTRFALVCLALIALRTAVLRIWDVNYINYLFLVVTIAAYPIMMVRSVRRAG